MREIKFRGKNIVSGEWLYGDFTPEKMWPTKLVDCVGECPSEPAQNVRPETVGQYTGLKDKNGREIYEGDVFRRNDVWTDTPFSVAYRDGQWIGVAADDTWLSLLQDTDNIRDDLGYIEVIGNIHDNPELLKT